MEIEIQPDDRVLLLTIPDFEAVRSLAIRAGKGLVVGMGGDDEVRAARKALADLDNVLFVLLPEDGTIPWKDEFFSKVIAPDRVGADSESLRVLARCGTLHFAGGSLTR
jgi:hypothetical protein